ncbi:MAG: tetratricopeptide repeat protein [Halioglobus sp.]|nr:tetratricopeptide repeat protein [Halioglobus sp.]
MRLDIAQGNYDKAAGRLDALRDSVGQDAELSFLHGEIALARGEKTQAQAQFMQAFELDPDHTAAVARLYELSLEGVGDEAFTDALETQLRESSLSAWKVRLLADSHLIQGNPQRARRYYESLLEHPELGRDPAVLNNLANIYAENDLDKALKTAMQALEGDGGESPALLDTVGWILTQQGREEEALPYLRKAHALNSTDPEIRYHTGVALLALGRDKEAAAELRAAVANGAGFDGRAQAQQLLDSLEE